MTIEMLSHRTFDWRFVTKNLFLQAEVPYPTHNEHFIRGYVPFLSQDFLTVYHKFTEAVYGSGLRPRNETCLSVVQEVMPIASARPYTEFVLPDAMRGIVEDMIVEVKTAFMERVNKSSYTKQKCYEKVDNISQRVAYPFSVYHETFLPITPLIVWGSCNLWLTQSLSSQVRTWGGYTERLIKLSGTLLLLPSTHTTIPRSINSLSWKEFWPRPSLVTPGLVTSLTEGLELLLVTN